MRYPDIYPKSASTARRPHATPTRRVQSPILCRRCRSRRFRDPSALLVAILAVGESGSKATWGPAAMQLTAQGALDPRFDSGVFVRRGRRAPAATRWTHRRVGGGRQAHRAHRLRWTRWQLRRGGRRIARLARRSKLVCRRDGQPAGWQAAARRRQRVRDLPRCRFRQQRVSRGGDRRRSTRSNGGRPDAARAHGGGYVDRQWDRPLAGGRHGGGDGRRRDVHATVRPHRAPPDDGERGRSSPIFRMRRPAPVPRPPHPSIACGISASTAATATSRIRGCAPSWWPRAT